VNDPAEIAESCKLAERSKNWRYGIDPVSSLLFFEFVWVAEHMKRQ
jgi:hypothetical protein